MDDDDVGIRGRGGIGAGVRERDVFKDIVAPVLLLVVEPAEFMLLLDSPLELLLPLG